MNFQHGGNVYKHIRESGTALSNVLDFSANINPLGMSPKGREAMEKAWEHLVHYPDPDYKALKIALAEYYQVPLEWLAVYNGAAEAMHACFSYLSPKSALLHGPSFVEYEKILTGIGTTCHWTLLEESNAFKLDINAYLETLNKYQPQLAVICTPNNPTGQKLTLSDLLAIENGLKPWQGILAIDEAFIDFCEDDESYGNCLESISRVVIFKSLTKFFGVPGLRLGALITPIAEFHEHDRLFGVPWRINSFAEQYAIEAVNDTAYINASKAYIADARATLASLLASIKGLKVYPSEADYILLKVTSEVALSLVEQLEVKNIMIRNCANYKGLGLGYFRVAVKNHDANEKLVSAIKEVLEK